MNAHYQMQVVTLHRWAGKIGIRRGHSGKVTVHMPLKIYSYLTLHALLQLEELHYARGDYVHQWFRFSLSGKRETRIGSCFL